MLKSYIAVYYNVFYVFQMTSHEDDVRLKVNEKQGELHKRKKYEETNHRSSKKHKSHRSKDHDYRSELKTYKR